jgi:ribonuclease H2 subunit A
MSKKDEIRNSEIWKMNEFFSNIKSSNEPVIVGIDEAGRGPVIGPMVYAAYVSYPSHVTQYKDSKLLSPKQRENLFDFIKNSSGDINSKVRGYTYFKVHPAYITTLMETKTMNLNEIAKEAVKMLLDEIKLKCKNVQKIYVDGLGDNTKYRSDLMKFFDYDFIIENKADSKYQVVSGASIVAKVVRDEDVKNLNCGSGYPGDEKTINWLIKNKDNFFGFPIIVRHSWKTVKNMLGERKGNKLGGELDGFYLN